MYRCSRPTTAALPLIAAGLAIVFSGCASSGEDYNFYVAPGKYVLYNCEQLALVSPATIAREKEVRELKAKAEQDGGGGRAVAFLAYDVELKRAQGSVAELRREAREKNCTLPPEDSSNLGSPKP